MFYLPLVYSFINMQQLFVNMLNYPATVINAATATMQQGIENI